MNTKNSFLNKYFIIMIVLVAVGGVYYFKFYKSNDTVDDNDSATNSALVGEKEGVSKASATTPKAPPKPVAQPKVEIPSTQTILLKNNFVSIKNNTFNPSVIVIKRGTEITWTNGDNTAHQIAPEAGETERLLSGLGSKTLSKGQSYIFMFTKPGTFDYFCRLHPFMKGTIIVTE